MALDEAVDRLDSDFPRAAIEEGLELSRLQKLIKPRATAIKQAASAARLDQERDRIFGLSSATNRHKRLSREAVDVRLGMLLGAHRRWKAHRPSVMDRRCVSTASRREKQEARA
jgi:hypothetical protein